ncbi:hypothetical protein [Acinetobacter gyllenbergii]|uniref:hypothetical protein n=1 Tax=Acinetobacter gyllenbergii TaxID=134534 RepID=UPI0003BEBD5A|nr:hypothetical protein [Acinetobacter gyllenbergii]ESK50756.1 hypothetical protein F987_01488 [Acinetobacter gyllenbergii NIPH 230]
MIKQLQPTQVPNDFCYWCHPDLVLIDPCMRYDGKESYTNAEWEQMKIDGGIQIQIEKYQFEDIPEISEADLSDWSNWKPKPPTEDHFLICAYDTENCDIVLWWAKEAKADAED